MLAHLHWNDDHKASQANKWYLQAIAAEVLRLQDITGELDGLRRGRWRGPARTEKRAEKCVISGRHARHATKSVERGYREWLIPRELPKRPYSKFR